ncbi:MAG: hypothetical protein PVJ40_02795 [Gammaproteobacteria bacterium]|jgi:hypothetical protein
MTLSQYGLLLLLACAGGTATATDADPVSIVNLIATPVAYASHTVRVIGYGRADFDGTVLYLDRASHDVDIPMNGIELDLSDSPLLAGESPAAFWKQFAFAQEKRGRNYLLVEGVFEPLPPDGSTAHAGRLHRITRLEIR